MTVLDKIKLSSAEDIAQYFVQEIMWADDNGSLDNYFVTPASNNLHLFEGEAIDEAIEWLNSNYIDKI